MNTIDVHIPGAFQPAAWYILRLLKEAAWEVQPDVALRLAGEVDPGAIHVNQRGSRSSAIQAVEKKAEQINAELAIQSPAEWLSKNGVGDRHTEFDVEERNRRMHEAKLRLVQKAFA